MDFDFRGLFGFVFGIGCAVVGLLWLLTWLFSSNEIESKEILHPIRYELTIENNQVDTIYVYEIK